MYFIDVQGTLISDEDKSPIRGAIEFIEYLNSSKTPYIIITNNTKKSPSDFYRFLKNSGFDFKLDNYLDPLMVLKNRLSLDESIAAYGSSEFLKTLESMGYKLDYKKPKVVLVAIKEDFSSHEFAQMIEFILSGAKLIGMHETSIYAKNNRRYPGVGAILKMLEFATSSTYEVVGKPSLAFYSEALSMIKKQNHTAKFNDITIISDDVKGDLVGAKELGMRCFFVTSGKYKDAAEIIPLLDERDRPDMIYKDMMEILHENIR
ncbi:MAG: HAD-IIA family hydrolase [Sulfurimonas sp.]|jgi:NagD protein|nr:HAD-IIA family hydrolase [Sulfurimonadaceae bacterium]